MSRAARILRLTGLIGRASLVIAVAVLALHLRLFDPVPFPKEMTFTGDRDDFTGCFLANSRLATRGHVEESDGVWALVALYGHGTRLRSAEGLRVETLPDGRYRVSDAYDAAPEAGRRADKRDWFTVWRCGMRTAGT